MISNQRTIKKEVSITGNGLHTGAFASMTFIPRPENYGIRFQRTDLADQTEIEASVVHVSDTSRGTTLSCNNASIQTVEHVLAAITGLGIDNLLITVDGPEIPIVDGSSLPFVSILEEAGLAEQSAPKNYITISEDILYRSDDGETLIEAYPHPTFMLQVEIDYGSEVLGVQSAALSEIADFKEEIASSRTFCFLHELEYLHRAGMIKGGDLSNAIVISERDIDKGELDYLAAILGRPAISPQKAGILSHTLLRYPNEPARHKLLDMIGDLTLAGHPIKGKIIAKKPGHMSNVEFVKRICELINQPAGQGV